MLMISIRHKDRCSGHIQVLRVDWPSCHPWRTEILQLLDYAIITDPMLTSILLLQRHLSNHEFACDLPRRSARQSLSKLVTEMASRECTGSLSWGMPIWLKRRMYTYTFCVGVEWSPCEPYLGVCCCFRVYWLISRGTGTSRKFVSPYSRLIHVDLSPFHRNMNNDVKRKSRKYACWHQSFLYW